LYLGIIDILQCYKTVKKIEHAWKSLLYDGDTVSVHRPSFYSERFERFMFGKVFVSLPMTESLRRLNAQNKQRPKLLKKTPEEKMEEKASEIKNIQNSDQKDEIDVETPSDQILPSDGVSMTEQSETIETEPLAIETEKAETETAEIKTVETESADLETADPETADAEKTSNDQNYSNLQPITENPIVANVTDVITNVTHGATAVENVTVSDEGDAKYKDQILSHKIDTSSAQIIREHVPKLKDEA